MCFTRLWYHTRTNTSHVLTSTAFFFCMDPGHTVVGRLWRFTNNYLHKQLSAVAVCICLAFPLQKHFSKSLHGNCLPQSSVLPMPSFKPSILPRSSLLRWQWLLLVSLMRPCPSSEASHGRSLHWILQFVFLERKKALRTPSASPPSLPLLAAAMQHQAPESSACRMPPQHRRPKHAGWKRGCAQTSTL